MQPRSPQSFMPRTSQPESHPGGSGTALPSLRPSQIGLQVELISHLFGAEYFPTGQRGLFAYWRTGSKVVNKAALWTLKIKS